MSGQCVTPSLQLALGLVLGTALSGCVTTEDLDARLKTWVGVDAEADELVAAWGAPAGNYVKKDGGHIMTWERTGIATTGVSAFPQAYTRRCRIDVTTDPAGKIVAARWSGAHDQCSEAISPRGSPALIPED